MIDTHVDSLNRTIQKTHAWLKSLTKVGFEDEAQAYQALRSVLHAIRDRMNRDEAVHLGAQLPMLVRGFYYDGWKPDQAALEIQDRTDLYQRVQRNLGPTSDVDPAHAVEAVFKLLDRELTPGEIAHVRSQMPEDIEKLWPRPAGVGD